MKIYTKYLVIDNLLSFIQFSIVFIYIPIETFIEDIIFTQHMVVEQIGILLGCITYMGYHRTQ